MNMTYEYVSQFFMLLLALLLGAFLACMLRRWTRSPSSQTDLKSTASSESQASPAQASPAMESTKAEAPAAVAAVAEEPPAPKPEPKPELKPELKSEPEPEQKSEPKPVQARGLDAAIGGQPDDLKIISGIGPKLEQTLNGLGIFHFEQIAGWSAKDVGEVDDLLSFKGRIERDDWIAQAKKMMND